ncbi:AAA family ATPase [Marinitoga sp. 1155]|uniref:AAA family ATPase n=1 Tax=Marinitoga sp. 1155 TaxID=1428448 RepID=UPI00064105DA|nr:AAA family ATPase [Marinitoga sp. 1155]KLO23486.1 ATPase [Marinitoga sp. 1155]
MNKLLNSKFIQFVEKINEMKKIVISKDEVIDTIAAGFITNTNVLLVGEPGTAKSFIIGEFCRRMGFDSENGYFHYLLTKFTEPSEILGALDINELKNGRYIINTKNKLPEAKVVFLDEVFNANSAILNSLLTIINEKKLLVGDMYKKLNDLIVIYGATNHTPTDPFLKAFYDRFPIRVLVENIERSQFMNLLDKEFIIEKEYFIEKKSDSIKSNSNKKDLNFDSIEFSKEINKYIINYYPKLRRYNKNMKIIKTFLDYIHILRSDKEIFISDRNIKYYIKMMIAYSMIRRESLKIELDFEDASFILTKIFDHEEQKYEIEREFIY